MSEAVHEDLPLGWTRTKLGDIIEKVSLTGKKLKRSNYQKKGKYPVIDQGQKFVGGYTDKEKLKVCCEQPIVVFGDHTRVIKYVDFDFVAGADGVKIVKPLKDLFIPKLFYYFVKVIPLPDRGYARHFQFLEKSTIPIPPLPEQHRIVAKIESLLEETIVAGGALDKIQPLIDRFRQSVLAKAFRGELTQEDPNDEPAQKLLDGINEARRKKWEKEIIARGKAPRKHKCIELEPVDIKDLPEVSPNWTWTNIGAIETFIGSGITPRGGEKVYVKDGVPFLRSQNVYPDGLHLENVAHVTPELHAQMKRTHVRPGDVLLNITGASIGRSTYIPDDFGPANVSQHVCIIRTGRWILPQYLSNFLNSPLGQSQIFSAQSGITREGLNYTQLRALHVPFAPLAEQRRIVARIKGLFTLVDQVEKAVRVARNRAETIEQAILAKAFRGGLVPQDPKDEPASALLQRIKAEAEIQVKAKKKKRRIRPPTTVQQRLTKPPRSIRVILKEMGQVTVEQIHEASGLSLSDFWDELKMEIDAGQIEQIRKGSSVFLKVKS